MQMPASAPTAHPTAPPVGHAPRARPRHLTSIANEAPASYQPDAGAPTEPPADQAPFGCPVLRELPELAATLDRVASADRMLIDAVLQLRGLLDAGRIETTTGIGIDHWLAATARMAGLDRRMLRRMCRLLDRLPALADGAATGRVSFTQLRALTLELRQTPRDIDGQLDTWLAATIEQLPDDADPDVLVRQAARAADELTPQLLDDQADEDHRHGRGLVIQPDLVGTGGTFHGTEDALGLAILEAATAPRRDQLDNAARARADNLRAHLCHTAAPAADSDSDTGSDTDPDDQAATVETTPGPTTPQAPDSPDAPTDPTAFEVPATPSAPAVPVTPPTVLLRWDYRALLDHAAMPADLLTRLVGGRLRLSSHHARELIEARGARIRSVIVDSGEVIGVGRATRVPPGWLREAVLAVHDTCTGPLCDRPALGAEVDHATPWHPDGAGPAGRTDVDNLGPLCASTNRDRRASGWRLDQTRDGVRTWHHPRSGVRITSLPATWRPYGIPPPHGTPPPPGRPPDPPHRTSGRSPGLRGDPVDDEPF